MNLGYVSQASTNKLIQYFHCSSRGHSTSLPKALYSPVTWPTSPWLGTPWLGWTCLPRWWLPLPPSPHTSEGKLRSWGQNLKLIVLLCFLPHLAPSHFSLKSNLPASIYVHIFSEKLFLFQDTFLSIKDAWNFISWFYFNLGIFFYLIGGKS